MFIDKAGITVTAGRGGAGCVSFRREKYIPFGGPDGGNGGKGGDVYLFANYHLTTLLDLRQKPHYKAPDGEKGGTTNKYGRGAEDLIIQVPCGTVVKKNGEITADLKNPGQKILIAKGGRGGRGNTSFKTARNTAPRVAELGEPGEEAFIELELKLIADIGLVGLPNAGKSTLLSRVSAARPKIADYPFTTLSPNLGVMNFKNTSVVVADIPGLIEGAHDGKGLGDEFLRHVDRTKILIHLLDISGFDGKTPYKNYRTIVNEIKKYSPALAKKPMMLSVNKMDLTDSGKNLAALRKKIKSKIYPISCATGKGIDELFSAAIKELSKPVKEEAIIKHEVVKKYTYEPEFEVRRTKDGFLITGRKVEKLADMTNFNEEESWRRFSNILKKMGVDRVMREQGIKEGDSVRVGSLEFIFKKY